jgi:hypothetical protein
MAGRAIAPLPLTRCERQRAFLIFIDEDYRSLMAWSRHGHLSGGLVFARMRGLILPSAPASHLVSVACGCLHG